MPTNNRIPLTDERYQQAYGKVSKRQLAEEFEYQAREASHYRVASKAWEAFVESLIKNTIEEMLKNK